MMKKIHIGRLVNNKQMKQNRIKNRVIKKGTLGIIFLVIVYATTVAQETYVKTGIASYYGNKFEGRETASGEIYYHAKRTAAHRTLPFGSIVKVTNLETSKYVVVRINDRGPFVDNRIIDLSKSAATELGFVERGLTKVKVELIASTDDLPDDTPAKNKNLEVREYFKVNANKVTPTGKGIQIGSFQNNDNVFRLVEEVKRKYNEEVFIEVAKIKKQPVYRVIVGSYKSDSVLQNLQKKLSGDYPGCFVVTFKN